MEIWEWEISKLLYAYGDLGKDLSTVNLQAEFPASEIRKFLFGYLEVVVAPAN